MTKIRGECLMIQGYAGHGFRIQGSKGFGVGMKIQ